MFNYIIYRIGEFISLCLPLKAGYWLAGLLSKMHYLILRSDRLNVRNNLKIIFPQKSAAQIRAIEKKMFKNFAKYLVDFFRFSKLDKEYIKKNIKIENKHYFDEALLKGRGVIVLSAHLGNWELGGVVIAASGYPFWVVVLPHKHKYVDNFFNRQRLDKGVNVIPLGRAVRQSLSVLQENKLLGLVGDRDFTQRGAIIDFFGKPTYFPVGPAAFALKTGSPIVPGFMVRNSDDTFTLKMEKPINAPAEGKNREEDIAGLIRHYKVIIEDYIKKYPEQWYMFRKFWI